MSVTTKATIASFGGKLLKASHAAKTTNCEMNFNLYLPPQAVNKTVAKVPLLIYLSGLTCTADNCSEKGFFQHGASKHGIAVLYPDTSPRASPSPPVYTYIMAGKFANEYEWINRRPEYRRRKRRIRLWHRSWVLRRRYKGSLQRWL